MADVEAQARQLVSTHTGQHRDDIQLAVDVCLPDATAMRLSLAEQLTEEALEEVDAAIVELIEAGISALDIHRIIHYRGLSSPRALRITNDEIARHGLTLHPDVVGLQWDDHGRFLTVTCRTCVETTRTEYLDLSPEGENVPVYRGPIRCDRCELDYPASGAVG